jgi:hypothetical protein
MSIEELLKLNNEILNRIKETEADLNHIPSFEYIDNLFNNHVDKIQLLNKIIDDLQINSTVVQCRIKDLENQDKNGYMFLKGAMDRIDDRLKELEVKNKNKIPHKCPICNGNGKIEVFPRIPVHHVLSSFIRDAEGRFYNECESCQGNGILWG